MSDYKTRTYDFRGIQETNPPAPSASKCGCSVTQGAVHCMHGNLIEAASSGRCKREMFDPPCDCCPPYGPLMDEQPSAPIGFNEFGNPNDPADFYPSASDERESSELERMKYWMNQYLQAYAPDLFNEPEGFTPKLDMNSAALVRRTLLKILNPSEEGK